MRLSKTTQLSIVTILLSVNSAAYAADGPIIDSRNEEHVASNWTDLNAAQLKAKLNDEFATAEWPTASAVQENKPAINFVPFPLQDRTGRPVDANTVIKIMVLQKETTELLLVDVLAGSYFKTVNDVEKSLNLRGYSLRTVATNRTNCVCFKTPLDQTMQTQKQDAQTARSDVTDPKVMAPADSMDEMSARMTAEKESSVKGYRELMDEMTKAGMAQMPPIVQRMARPQVVTQHETVLNNLLHKNWEKVLGQEDSFALKGNAYLNFGVNMSEISGAAGANSNISIMNLLKLQLLDAEASGKGVRSGDVHAQVFVNVFGGTVYHKEYKDHYKIDILQQGASQDSSRKWTMKKGVSYRFAVGPIPMKGEIGAAGSIGYDFGTALVGATGVDAGVVGYARVAGYCSVSVDVAVAGAGIEGNLTVLEEDLKISGFGQVRQDQATGKTQIVTGVHATNNLSALSGSFSAFAQMDLGPLGSKRWDFQIFAWPGLHLDEVTLFSFDKIMELDGRYSLSGAPKQEDYASVDVDQGLHSTMSDAMDSLHRESQNDRVTTELNAASTKLGSIDNQMTVLTRALTPQDGH